MMPYVVHTVFAQEQMEENSEARRLTSSHNAVSRPGRAALWLFTFEVYRESQ